MSLTRASSILQVGANLSILAGLALVSVQIYEANRIANTQFAFDAWGGAIQANDIILGDNFADSWTKAQCNSSDLNVKDTILVDAFLTREWLHNTRIDMVRMAGFAQADHSFTAAKWVFGYLGNDTSMTWWQTKDVFLKSNPDLRNAVNELLAEQGDSH